jgi:hypothetical protein
VNSGGVAAVAKTRGSRASFSDTADVSRNAPVSSTVSVCPLPRSASCPGSNACGSFEETPHALTCREFENRLPSIT